MMRGAHLIILVAVAACFGIGGYRIGYLGAQVECIAVLEGHRR